MKIDPGQFRIFTSVAKLSFHEIKWKNKKCMKAVFPIIYDIVGNDFVEGRHWDFKPSVSLCVAQSVWWMRGLYAHFVPFTFCYRLAETNCNMLIFLISRFGGAKIFLTLNGWGYLEKHLLLWYYAESKNDNLRHFKFAFKMKILMMIEVRKNSAFCLKEQWEDVILVECEHVEHVLKTNHTMYTVYKVQSQRAPIDSFPSFSR